MKIIVKGPGYRWEQRVAIGPKAVTSQLSDLDCLLRDPDRWLILIDEAHDGPEAVKARRVITDHFAFAVSPRQRGGLFSRRAGLLGWIGRFVARLWS